MTRARCGRCRKAIYTSRNSAEDARRNTPPEPDSLNVYPCPHRDGVWHVGHTSSRLGPLLAIERAARREPPDLTP